MRWSIHSRLMNCGGARGTTLSRLKRREVFVYPPTKQKHRCSIMTFLTWDPGMLRMTCFKISDPRPGLPYVRCVMAIKMDRAAAMDLSRAVHLAGYQCTLL